jgi:hypothetical protein
MAGFTLIVTNVHSSVSHLLSRFFVWLNQSNFGRADWLMELNDDVTPQHSFLIFKAGYLGLLTKLGSKYIFGNQTNVKNSHLLIIFPFVGST